MIHYPQEQPWRKTGVDLALYFNYGFNEATWLDYAEKQLRFRMEEGRGMYTSFSN